MPYVTLVIRWCCRVAGILYSCFLEARPAVQGIFLLRFLAGASFAGSFSGGEVSNFALWTGVALWICATLSVYILNGIMDVEEDRINGSSRPVASGKLSVTHATCIARHGGQPGGIGEGYTLPSGVRSLVAHGEGDEQRIDSFLPRNLGWHGQAPSHQHLREAGCLFQSGRRKPGPHKRADNLQGPLRGRTVNQEAPRLRTMAAPRR